jgi:hypothetical protein
MFIPPVQISTDDDGIDADPELIFDPLGGAILT